MLEVTSSEIEQATWSGFDGGWEQDFLLLQSTKELFLQLISIYVQNLKKMPSIVRVSTDWIFQVREIRGHMIAILQIHSVYALKLIREELPELMQNML
jgi:hypothetical protein